MRILLSGQETRNWSTTVEWMMEQFAAMDSAEAGWPGGCGSVMVGACGWKMEVFIFLGGALVFVR